VRPANEGALTLRLEVADGAVRAVHIASSRIVTPSSVLVGRGAEEAVALLPRLYSICAMAQGAAAAGALAAAQDRAPDPRGDRAVLVEMLESHAWCAMVDWPRLLGEAPSAPPLIALRNAVPTLREGIGGIETARTALRAGAFGSDGLPRAEDGFAPWAARGETPAQRLLQAAIGAGMGFGASTCPALPPLPAAWFAMRLAGDPSFPVAPSFEGAAAEVGPLARSGRTGDLVARLVARLREMEHLLDRLADPREGLAVQVAGGAGVGCAVVDTARGPLAHWLALDGARIAAWRSVAPTEWNFRAAGPAANGLLGARDDEKLAHRAALHAAALDPCVPSHIEVAHA
jgi:coenzyme F420-reducing hydrogenase alpha subunit